MSLAKIREIKGLGLPVDGDDIDTDRIIPARFMKCVTFDGLGEYLFYDVKHDQQGNKTSHPLNQEEYAKASILVSGNNFGCGSSREHAPQAISKAGFKAVIAEGYAEIFFGNSTQLGIPCVRVSHQDRLKLQDALFSNPALRISIDLEAQVVRFGQDSIPCQMPQSNRDALMEGKWDPLQDLLDNQAKIEETARGLSYL